MFVEESFFEISLDKTQITIFNEWYNLQDTRKNVASSWCVI